MLTDAQQAKIRGKMKNLKLVFTLLFCLFALNIFSCGNHAQFKQCNHKIDFDQSDEIEFNKTYVELEEVIFESNNIFIIKNENIYSVKAIYTDPKGLYVKLYKTARPQARQDKIRPLDNVEQQKFSGTCWNKHPIYHKECGGCAMPLCVFRCKCFNL